MVNTFSAFKKKSVEKGSSRWCRGFCFGRCCWSPAAVPRRFFRACALRSLAPLCRTRCSRPESGAMTSSPSVTIILVYVAAASYLLYWVGLMGIHLIAILYGWVAPWMVVCWTVLKTGRVEEEESVNVEMGRISNGKPAISCRQWLHHLFQPNATRQPPIWQHNQTQGTNKQNRETNVTNKHTVCTCFNQMQPLVCQQFCRD